MSGLSWQWDGNGEYVDYLGSRRAAVEIVGHMPCNHYVRGDRSRDQPAADDEVEEQFAPDWLQRVSFACATRFPRSFSA